MPVLPRLDPIGRPSADPAALVLVLHGGRANSTESGEPKRLAYRRMLPFAKVLARRPELDVQLLRYRVRGWNAPRKDAQRDAEWGIAELAKRHPGRPIVLVGHSMGGRAALGAAGSPGVTAVCALAPWLDDSDPVDQLAGRSVLIAHGNRERWTSPRASYEYALRAAAVTDRIARFDVHGGGHFMITRSSDWHGLVRRFVMGVTGLEPEDHDIANAMRQPAPGGLRVALAAGRRPGADP